MNYIILDSQFEYRVDKNNIIKSVLLNEIGQPLLRENLLWKIKDATIKEPLSQIQQKEDVRLMPAVGEPLEEGVLYTWETGLIKCRQSHNRTIYDPADIPALFSFFRENSDDLEWIPNELVEVGWNRVYEGTTYTVLQRHMTQSDWTPDSTPTLWAAESSGGTEWATGVSYTIGDVVTYNGNEYECRQSHTSQAGWTPSAVLSLWLPL